MKHKLKTLVLLLLCAACKQPAKEQQDTTTNTVTTTSAQKERADITIDPPYQSSVQTPEGRFDETIDPIPVMLKSFMLPGYHLIFMSSGDANLDGRADRIMVFDKDMKSKEDEQSERPLLLLLAQADCSFKLAQRSDKAVYCMGCGGAFGDPFTGITIKNGYFSIEHGIAGGQHWEQVTTFKYDKAAQTWFLYKDHFISYRMSTEADHTEDALVTETDKLETVRDFGKVAFATYDLYEDRD